MRELQSTFYGKHRGEVDNQETTKAAAWAVFQHHGRGAGMNNRVHGHPVRRATRFKIEAQMKHEIGHRSVSEDALTSWDAGSTLFDSYELDSLFKQLGRAFHPVEPPQTSILDDSEYAGSSIHNPHLHPHPHQYHSAHHGSHDFRGQTHNEEEHHFCSSPELDPIDEMLTLDVRGRRYGQGLDGIDQEDSERRAQNLFDEVYRKDGHEASQGKLLNAFHFLHTPHKWNMLKGKRRSFDTSPQVELTKEAPRKWKLRNIFHSSSHQDGAARMRHARIAPHDSPGRKGSEGSRGCRSNDETGDDGPIHAELGDQYHHGRGAEFDGHHYIDAAKYLEFVAQDVHARSNWHDYQDHHLFPQVLKAGVQVVLARPFSRLLHLSGGNDDSDLTSYDSHKQHGGQKQGSELQKARQRPLSSYSIDHHHQTQDRYECRILEHELAAKDRYVLENKYHHEHHHHPQGRDQEDYELTVQAIVRRVPRKSFEEKAHQLSIEENELKVPRHSLKNFKERLHRSSWEFCDYTRTGSG